MSSKLSRAKIAREELGKLVDSLTSNVVDTEALLQAKQEARDVITAVAEDCQRQCQNQISYVVTRCLKAVFRDQPIRFRLIFEHKRNQTEVRAVFTDEHGRDYDPLEACGGGMVDVAAFGLRLACLMLRRPKPDRVLVLDEPFKWVSAGYRKNVAQMLRDLATKFDMQIVLITHLPELVEAGDNLVEIG